MALHPWMTFILSSAVIVFAGSKLCLLGDVIGEKLKLGRIWIGAFLLALVTSLPEVFTSITAVLVTGSPDLAYGNIFGSFLFNLLLIAIIDMMMGPKLIFEYIDRRIDVVLSLMFVMLGVAMFAFYADIPRHIGPLGWDSVLIIFVYIMGIRIMFRAEKRRGAQPGEAPEELLHASASLARSLALFGLFSAVLILAAVKMSESADRLAEVTGLGRTFVGTLFLALVTSLPEFIVSYSAIRHALYGMAVGNLLGSNIFNITIMPAVDLCFPNEAAVRLAGREHTITILFGFLMSAVVFLGMLRKPKHRVGPLGVESMFLIFIYVLAMYTLYQLRSGGI